MTYYPIGTVVMLKNGTHPIMIYGRKQLQAGNDFIWDYVACLYPEGNIEEDYTFFFQKEEISEVLHLGLQGVLEDKMLKILNQ